MIAAVIALAVALAAFIAPFTYVVIQFVRSSSRIEGLVETRGKFALAVEQANHSTTRANGQTHEIQREAAEYKRGAEGQLDAMRKEIDALEQQFDDLRTEAAAAGVPVAVLGATADRLRRVREASARRGAGDSGRGPAAVPGDPATGTGGGSGGAG